MPRLLRQTRRVHAQGIHACIGEDLAAETREVAVYAADELLGGGEQREVPGEEGFVNVCELAEHFGWLLRIRVDALERGGGGEGQVAGCELGSAGVGRGGGLVEEEVVFAAERRPLLVGFADDAHVVEGEGGDLWAGGMGA